MVTDTKSLADAPLPAPEVHENGVQLIYARHDYQEQFSRYEYNLRCRHCYGIRNRLERYDTPCVTPRPQRVVPAPPGHLNRSDRARSTPATPKQVSYLRGLISRDYSAATSIGIAQADPAVLTKSEATKYVEWLVWLRTP